jgi:hypothetical protein
MRYFVDCLGLLLSVIAMLSCGRDQQLVSIDVEPSGGFVFEGVGAKGQFTAIGTYIHPPEKKDITTQVLWRINVANLAEVSQTGLVRL